MIITNKKFEEEFDVPNDDDIKYFLSYVKKNWVCDMDELRMIANIAKHVEESRIDLVFSETLKLEDIPDDIIVTMLENIENRLQYISGDEYFIILHRIHDNHIIKREITDNNKEEIEQLILQCDDGNVYDVVLIS